MKTYEDRTSFEKQLEIIKANNPELSEKEAKKKAKEG